VLPHTTAVKCVSGFSEIILGAGVVAEWSSSVLACMLTWLEWGIFGNQALRDYSRWQTEELWRRIKQFASEINNAYRIFESFRVYFSHRDVIKSVNIKAISSISYEKVEIKRLLISYFFLLMHNTLNLVSI
jgi:hypothetical protein